MMSESLAEYSALRIAQKKYGDDQMHKFLKHELDGYLRGRAGEAHKEPPIVLVQREAYVWYQKGSLVLYGLADYIGEDKLNLALHNFLMQYRYANATDNQDVPLPRHSPVRRSPARANAARVSVLHYRRPSRTSSSTTTRPSPPPTSKPPTRSTK